MERSIYYKGQPVFYTVSGEGTPLVLIHGFAEDRNVWKYQVNPPGLSELHSQPSLRSVAPFERGIKLIIPDLPGSGKSGLADSEKVTMDSMADVIKAILDEEYISSCIMIGHSMGGYVTLAFAEKYPELLKAFGLFHSTAYADTEEKKEVRKKSIEFIRKHGSHEFLKQSSPNTFSDAFKEKHPEKVEELLNDNKNFNPEALITYYKAMMQRPDRTQVLKNSPYPVLFIIGQHDNAVPLNDSLQQCHMPASSYIYILKDSGHMGMWEEPAEANQILSQFIKDVST